MLAGWVSSQISQHPKTEAFTNCRIDYALSTAHSSDGGWLLQGSVTNSTSPKGWLPVALRWLSKGCPRHDSNMRHTV